MPVTFTRRGTWEGVVMMLPMVHAVCLFGVAVGATAVQKGLTLGELTVMNLAVYAGSSQLVALGIWQGNWTLAGLITIAMVTFVVNARMILMGASLRPWFAPVSPKLIYPSLFFLTDANWIMGQRYYNEGGRDVGVFFGAGFVLWVLWGLSPIAGFMLGNFVRDQRAYAIDLFMPVFFAGMVARLWKGRSDSLAWLAAGALGLIAERYLGGGMHVIIGALAGMAIAAALVRPQAPAPDGGKA